MFAILNGGGGGRERGRKEREEEEEGENNWLQATKLQINEFRRMQNSNYISIVNDLLKNVRLFQHFLRRLVICLIALANNIRVIREWLERVLRSV